MCGRHHPVMHFLPACGDPWSKRRREKRKAPTDTDSGCRRASKSLGRTPKELCMRAHADRATWPRGGLKATRGFGPRAPSGGEVGGLRSAIVPQRGVRRRARSSRDPCPLGATLGPRSAAAPAEAAPQEPDPAASSAARSRMARKGRASASGAPSLRLALQGSRPEALASLARGRASGCASPAAPPPPRAEATVRRGSMAAPPRATTWGAAATARGRWPATLGWACAPRRPTTPGAVAAARSPTSAHVGLRGGRCRAAPRLGCGPSGRAPKRRPRGREAGRRPPAPPRATRGGGWRSGSRAIWGGRASPQRSRRRPTPRCGPRAASGRRARFRHKLGPCKSDTH